MIQLTFRSNIFHVKTCVFHLKDMKYSFDEHRWICSDCEIMYNKK